MKSRKGERAVYLQRAFFRSAELLKKKLENLEAQQGEIRYWLVVILGSASALIDGLLSVLEFRQSMYVSALLKSFGVSSWLLGLRSVIENLIIVNVVCFFIVTLLMKNHDVIFAFLKVKASANVEDLYLGDETL